MIPDFFNQCDGTVKLVRGTIYYDGEKYQRWAFAHQEEGVWFNFDQDQIITDVVAVLDVAALTKLVEQS